MSNLVCQCLEVEVGGVYYLGIREPRRRRVLLADTTIEDDHLVVYARVFGCVKDQNVRKSSPYVHRHVVR